MACPNCGSWAVKADRSLAGRMVCARCGEPLGIGRGRRIARGPGGGPLGRGSSLTLPRRWRLWLGLGALLTVSALLAALPERTPRPLQRPGFGASRGAALPAAAPGVGTAGASGDIAIR
ncbi:MAG: hypothetical protein ER33_12365 [Cyanobium sp. CACIAM 14]|nr:MAG: hypothetical protein ER33_12365 [Cyanobium sp. CACIAM 14]